LCCRKNLGDGPLEFEDILPDDPKEYDKMQPPKEEGKRNTLLSLFSLIPLNPATKA
jgi:hypothetical protein